MTVQQVHVWAIGDANNDDVKFFFPEETNGPFSRPPVVCLDIIMIVFFFFFYLILSIWRVLIFYSGFADPFWYFSFSSLVGRYFLLRNIIRHSEGCERMAPIPIEFGLRWKPLWASASSPALLSRRELWHLYTRTPFVICEHCLSILHSLSGVCVCWGDNRRSRSREKGITIITISRSRNRIIQQKNIKHIKWHGIHRGGWRIW